MIAKVFFKKLNPKAKVPLYAHSTDSGCDVSACIDEPIVIASGARALIPTGLAFSIQDGFDCQVRSRSGLAINKGVIVGNSPGTVDNSYTGEIKVILINLSDEGFVVNPGDRVAQLVFSPITQAHFVETAELPDTDRGAGGFGSSGVK